MNEIFDKLGLYDTIAVLLSGICMTVVTLIFNQYVWKISSDTFGILDNSLVFLVASYLVGVIFQELGSLIMGAIFKDDKLLKEAMCADGPEYDKDYRYVLTETERIRLNEIFHASKTDGIDDLYKYNFCRFYLLKKKKGMSRPDKDQALAAFSRSMILYFVGLAVLIVCTTSDALIRAGGGISTVILGVLFYYRYVRFTKMRYIYIIRNFLYFYEIDQNNGEG